MAKPDLDKLSFEELTVLIAEAKAALDAKRDGARTELVAEMRAKAEALGLDLSSLLTSAPPATRSARKPRVDAGKPVEAKYRGPGGETWTGRGRKPLWLSELENQGKDKEEFRI